jgi:hypothetical protein
MCRRLKVPNNQVECIFIGFKITIEASKVPLTIKIVSEDKCLMGKCLVHVLRRRTGSKQSLLETSHCYSFP